MSEPLPAAVIGHTAVRAMTGLRLRTAGSVVLGLIVLGAMVGLAGVLVSLLGQERALAMEALAASAEQARSGEHPYAGLPEGGAVEDALVQASAVRVTNFTVQTGTACYSVAFEGLPGRTGAFVYRVVGDQREVLDASLGRECWCSDLDLSPCVLR